MMSKTVSCATRTLPSEAGQPFSLKERQEKQAK
jgi:hypothetical protein